ncbi:MAG: site-2 protease family protein [Defluviitaleaceae bacterium]|nr:site-2 protease family protein [Defluviitaleaceae bacterium]MCL2239626.1 site-2 protease family protein [Defluviitaleaceae bacterium]
MTTAIWILFFLLILGVVIFVHELGHFLAARRAGVFVEEFALGMGPKLFSFNGKTEQIKVEKPEDAPAGNEGEDVEYVYVEEHATVYSLRMFPIGGFCKMRGQDDDMPADDRALNNKSIPARMLVMAGGSLMNFLLAFVLFFVLTLLTGYQVTEVRDLVEGRPAQQAGLQVGDRITHINGARVSLYENFLLQMEFSGGEPVEVRFVRDGAVHHVTITPLEVAPGMFRLGFMPDIRFGLLEEPREGFGRVGLWGTTVTSAEMMVFNIRIPFTMLARWVSNQRMPAEARLAGPIDLGNQFVTIAQETSEHGLIETFLFVLLFAAVISAAIGLFNLLPIPAMDGARLVFLAIEGIRRKPVSPEREGMVHLVGFGLLIALAIFIAYRDIVRLLPS